MEALKEDPLRQKAVQLVINATASLLSWSVDIKLESDRFLVDPGTAQWELRIEIARILDGVDATASRLLSTDSKTTEAAQQQRLSEHALRDFAQAISERLKDLQDLVEPMRMAQAGTLGGPYKSLESAVDSLQRPNADVRDQTIHDSAETWVDSLG